MMNYKHFTVWFMRISISLMICICAIICIIDPLAMFNIVNIKGFNHYKGIQNRYIDIWKPYDIKDKKPDIIFIGSSRVGNVIDTRMYKTNDVVYNAGFNSLTLKHMDAYLDMVYKIKKPKKIYIGLDFFQFDKGNFQKIDRNGFSNERIQKICSNDKTIWLYKLKENLGIDGRNIVKVIKNSSKNDDLTSEYISGYWNTRYNNSFNINKGGFYESINTYSNMYSRWKLSQEAIDCFKLIVKKAKRNNVEVIVYFNPVSIELINLMRIHKVNDDYERVKREVTSICGVVYDFNFVNKDIINKKYFMDSSHANRLYGNIIIRNLNNKKDSKNMLVLTRKNINSQLQKERKNFVEWKKKNSKYYASMEKKLKGNKKVKEGDFKEFIGF